MNDCKWLWSHSSPRSPKLNPLSRTITGSALMRVPSFYSHVYLNRKRRRPVQGQTQAQIAITLSVCGLLITGSSIESSELRGGKRKCWWEWRDCYLWATGTTQFPTSAANQKGPVVCNGVGSPQGFDSFFFNMLDIVCGSGARFK